jgi:hypothetical protein
MQPGRSAGKSLLHGIQTVRNVGSAPRRECAIEKLAMPEKPGKSIFDVIDQYNPLIDV